MNVGRATDLLKRDGVLRPDIHQYLNEVLIKLPIDLLDFRLNGFKIFLLFAFFWKTKKFKTNAIRSEITLTKMINLRVLKLIYPKNKKKQSLVSNFALRSLNEERVWLFFLFGRSVP